MRASDLSVLEQLTASIPEIKDGDLNLIGRMITLMDEFWETNPMIDSLKETLKNMTLNEGGQFLELKTQALTRAQDALSMAPHIQSDEDSKAQSGNSPEPFLPPPPKENKLKEESVSPDQLSMETDEERELFLEFVEESITYLQSVELNVLTLEGDPHNLSIIDNIFRPFHTIKGVAGFLGLKTLHRVCHALESLLDDARKEKITIHGPISDLILETVDQLKTVILGLQTSPNPAAMLEQHRPNIEELTGRINTMQQNPPQITEEPQGDNHIRDNQTGESQTGGSQAPPVSSTPEEKQIGDQMPEEVAAQNSEEPPPMAETTSVPVTMPVTTSVVVPMPPPQTSGPEVSKPAILEAVQKPAPPPIPSPPVAPQNASAAREAPVTGLESTSGNESIRVRINMLDQLMTLAGELVLGRNQLLQKTVDMVTEVPGLNSVIQQLDRVTSELQESVMKTRMQPLGGLFSRFHRVIRDLSRSLGKEISLIVNGETVELDKTLIEALSDPLTHLVRNCADHGIESPQARVANGKDPNGMISLNAYHEGGKVHVTISDDGGGIQVEKIREKAIEQGLTTREQANAMGEREVLRFLFAPGFSTAEKVTGVSGRGVGMDVVISNIEKIGGTVEIHTEVGKGTTFLLDLPLTLAIVPALLVRAQNQRFAIPQINLQELIHLDNKEMHTNIMDVRGSEVYRLRGNLIPLLRLNQMLSLNSNGTQESSEDAAPEKNEAESIYIVVLTSGQTRFGLVVDQVFDTEEIVVKPLSNLLKNVSVFAGATLMGDGHVALILDVSGLAKSANFQVEEEQRGGNFSKKTVKVEDQEQNIILFNVSPKEQFAVPLSLVSRLEEIPASQIHTAVNGHMLPYRGKLLPVIFMEEHLPIAPPAENREKVSVLVFEVEHQVGLVVSNVIDAVQTIFEIDPAAATHKGITGMALIREVPTAFVDIYQMTELAYPEWFRRETEKRKADPIPSDSLKVLLAEDSHFYRNVEKTYLIEEGFEVIEAEDGQQALDLLKENPVDLVVTDVEMPNMNGFELTMAIRADPKIAHIPVIAVTSLSDDNARAEGRKAGVDSYLVKLHREELREEVYRLIKENKIISPAAG